MNPLLQEALASVIRHVLGMAAMFLVSTGIWQQADAEKYVAAAALAVITLGWSFWQKYKSRIKLLSALSEPAPMSEGQLENKLAAGVTAAPSTATSKADVPKPAKA